MPKGLGQNTAKRKFVSAELDRPKIRVEVKSEFNAYP